MSKRGLAFVFLALHLSGIGGAAWACSCFGGLAFDEMARQSPVVLLGRVKAQGQMPDSADSTAPYLDVEVIEIFKGTSVGQVARLWDSYAGTNCGGGLDTLPPGTLAVFSVEENSHENGLPDLWKDTGIQPAADDYLFGTCSEFWKVFTTERRARRHMHRLGL